MKNRIIMIILLGIILSGTTLIAANTRKKSNKKRREPQTTKIKYKISYNNIFILYTEKKILKSYNS